MRRRSAEADGNCNDDVNDSDAGGSGDDDGDYNDETMEPTNNQTYYTNCRILLEKSLECYNNILMLRIQYPIAFNKNEK